MKAKRRCWVISHLKTSTSQYKRHSRRAFGSTTRSQSCVDNCSSGSKQIKLRWTPSGIPDAPPGALNNVTLIDGVKGKAALLNDSVGFAAKDVGRYERTQEFSLDFWVKLRTGDPYDSVSVLYNQGGRGGNGYELSLEENRLQFSLVHNAPYNMLGREDGEAVADRQMAAHERNATTDRARRLEQCSTSTERRPPIEIVRDRLTRTSMPRGGHSLYGSYYGLAFGKRFQVNEFKEGALDEIRVFRKALNPLEVAYLHDPKSLARIDEATLRRQLTQLLAREDEQVIEARQARPSRHAGGVGGRDAHPAADDRAGCAEAASDLRAGTRSLHPARQGGSAGVPTRVFVSSRKLAPNRAGLVDWMFDEKNPLTARVFVNRLWQTHFGTGIVETTDDFWHAGLEPHSSELLDWLAIEFVRSGWTSGTCRS